MRRLLWLLACLVPLAAQAHKPSDSQLTLALEAGNIDGRWDIALRDLEQAIGLDADGDGAVTWGELKAGYPGIWAYAIDRLVLEAGGRACVLAPLVPAATPAGVVDHSDGTYVVLRFRTECPWAAGPVALTYHLLADVDPLHRGLVRIEDGGRSHSVVLGPDKPTFSLVPRSAPDLLGQAISYLREGAWHIWVGLDHLLFLVSLLLPALLGRRDGQWRVAEELKGSLVAIVWTVSAFTVAHSLTLTLAALGIVGLPSRLVESFVAASIVAAALNNVWPVVTRRIWMVAFGFGLIHGLGFASALADLGLPESNLLLSLVSFNVGVELGQLVVVAMLLPLVLLMRDRPTLGRLALHVGSFLIALLGSLWLAERAFDMRLLV